MSLTTYNKKRDFKRTSEPKGVEKKTSSRKLIYVIQKHQASHLHYDLRLEMNGVLVSWAVPKEPPTEKGVKRLAVMTEDHPIGYEKFHGTIPEGEYGGGKVEIWDKGFYELKIKDEKKIEFFIHGKKLKGLYVLVKTNFGKTGKSWLLFKI
mgnify:CR=1 FL=1